MVGDPCPMHKHFLPKMNTNRLRALAQIPQVQPVIYAFLFFRELFWELFGRSFSFLNSHATYHETLRPYSCDTPNGRIRLTAITDTLGAG